MRYHTVFINVSIVSFYVNKYLRIERRLEDECIAFSVNFPFGVIICLQKIVYST